MPELLQLVKASGNYGVSSSGGARGRTFADGHLSTEGSKDLRLAQQGKQARISGSTWAVCDQV